MSEWVDWQLSPLDHASVSAHVETCAACRWLVSDLERVRSAARQLRPIAPPSHVWLEVAGQLRLERPTAAAGAAPAAAPRAAARQWIGLAAALVLVTFGAYLVTRVRVPARSAPAIDGNAPAAGSVEGIEQELKLAEEHYNAAIVQLEAIVKSEDSTIDPVTAAVLQKNLPVMNQAIAESRAALTGNPGNQAAEASLFEALRRKVSVLQDTVALMNEMRKGDQEGAARLAVGMGKS